MIKFRTAYDGKREGGDDLDFKGEVSLTKQADLPSSDINVILDGYARRGESLPPLNPDLFRDVSDAPSFQDALNLVIHAEEQFMALDAKVRQRFSNDPAQFMNFVHDPANGEELVKMGLATPKPGVDPTPSPAVPDPVAPPSRKANKPSNPDPDA